MRTREFTFSTDPKSISFHRTTVRDAYNGMYYPGTPTITESDVTSSVVISEQTRTFKDVVTPDFRKKIASGEVINNPMESHEVLEINTPAQFQYFSETQVCSYDKSDWSKHYTTWASKAESGECDFSYASAGAPSSFLSFPDLPDYGDERQKRIDIAVAKAYANINQSEVLMLAALAESKSTVAGLIQLMAQASKIISSVTKGHPDLKRLKRSSSKRGFTTKKLKRALDDTAEIYMNARYNLRPLYYDICGILRLFEKPPKHDRFTFRGYSQYDSKDLENTVFDHIHWVPMSSDSTLDFKIFRELEVLISARAGVLTRLEDASIWTRAGLNSIPETLWELVPFSFIADWFFTIGDTILAWTPKYGSSVLASWVVVEEQYTQRQKVVINDCESGTVPNPWAFPHAWSNVTMSLGEAFRLKVTKRKQRIVNPQRPILPSLDVSLDCLQLLDLAIISKKLLLNRKILTGVV